MRNTAPLLAFFIVLILPFSVGCGGGATSAANPTPTPVPGTTTPAGALSPSRFIYGITAFEADGIYAGQIDGATGSISPLAGNPYANTLGQNIVIQVPVDPKGRFFTH